MTIAAGFICKDGIIICADSEQTGSGVKFDRSKVFHADNAFCSYGMTGTGNTSYIGMAADILEDIFHSSEGQFSFRSPAESELFFLDLLRERIPKLHEHMRACSVPELGVTTLELIIGVRFYQGVDEKFSLVHIAADGGVSRIRPDDHCVFVGAGEAIAHSFARILIRDRMPIYLVRALATFIIFQSKRGASYCGGGTTVYVLPGNSCGGFHQMWDDTAMTQAVDNAIRLVVLDARNPDISDEDFYKTLDAFSNEMRDTRQSISKRRNDMENVLECVRRQLTQPLDQQSNPEKSEDQP